MYLNLAYQFLGTIHAGNLTLTRVVFEYEIDLSEIPTELTFNFNKSCIWIVKLQQRIIYLLHLTLTSVVFELATL